MHPVPHERGQHQGNSLDTQEGKQHKQLIAKCVAQFKQTVKMVLADCANPITKALFTPAQNCQPRLGPAAYIDHQPSIDCFVHATHDEAER